LLDDGSLESSDECIDGDGIGGWGRRRSRHDTVRLAEQVDDLLGSPTCKEHGVEKTPGLLSTCEKVKNSRDERDGTDNEISNGIDS
jgi:hypothetical protein